MPVARVGSCELFPYMENTAAVGSVEYVWCAAPPAPAIGGADLPQQSAGNPGPAVADLCRQRGLGVHAIRLARQADTDGVRRQRHLLRQQQEHESSVRPTVAKAHPPIADVDGAGRRRHDEDADAFREPAHFLLDVRTADNDGTYRTTRARSRTPSICSASSGRIRRRARSSGSTATSTTTSRRPARRRPWTLCRASGNVRELRLSVERPSGRRECGVLRRPGRVHGASRSIRWSTRQLMTSNSKRVERSYAGRQLPDRKLHAAVGRSVSRSHHGRRHAQLALPADLREEPSLTPAPRAADLRARTGLRSARRFLKSGSGCPRPFVPQHFADDAGSRFVAHAAAEDFDPIADLEAFGRDFLPKRAPHAERDVAVVQSMILAVGAVAAKDAAAGDHRAGRATSSGWTQSSPSSRPAKESSRISDRS